MNFSFENQGTHTYLVYKVQPEDVIDTMSLGMLTNNKISGLAHTIFTQMDSTMFIKYEISAKVSVKQFFAGAVNKKRLLGVFKGIVNAMLSAEDYMIDVNSIILDMDYIYADVSSCDTVLVCLPVISDDLSNRDLGAFFKNIMFSTQFDQTENCDHVAQIINYLNSAPVFSLEEFKKVLDNIGTVSAPAATRPVTPSPAVTQTVTPPQPVAQVAPRPMTAQPAAPRPVAPQPVAVQTAVPQPMAPQAVAPVPPVKKAKRSNVPAPQPVTNPAAEEKKVSMFDLLMHYSKENAEIYKAQKAQKKAQQGQMPATAPNPAYVPNPAPSAKSKKTASAGFAIPGQNTQAPVAPPQRSVAPPRQQAPVAPPQRPVVPPVQQAPVAPPQRPVVPPVQQAPVAPPQRPVTPPVQQAPVANVPQYTPAPMPQGKSMSFGETTVLSGGGVIGETTVLGAGPATQTRPHLVRSKNNEKINLDKPVFRIGKERSYVDYFIGDNPAISRSHANIISRDGEYFVVDTNSTNHTYVNGQMIQSNVETKISHNTMIKLGNEDFEFRLY